MLRIASIIRWLLVAAIVLLLAVPALAVTAGGRQIVEVDGESMTPTYQLGDLLLLREPTEEDLRVGNVVTAVDGNGDLYTHRIIETLPDGTVQLQGDGNAAPDPSPVGLEQLRGAVELHLGQPWAMLVLQLQQWPVRICLLAVILGLALLPLGARVTGPAEARPRRSAGMPPAAGYALRERSATSLPVGSGTPSGAPESTPAVPSHRITVVDGPDGQPRVRVSIDLDAAALSLAATVATPVTVAAVEPPLAGASVVSRTSAVLAGAARRPGHTPRVPVRGVRRRHEVPTVARTHRADPRRGRRRAG